MLEPVKDCAMLTVARQMGVDRNGCTADAVKPAVLPLFNRRRGEGSTNTAPDCTSPMPTFGATLVANGPALGHPTCAGSKMHAHIMTMRG